MAGLYFLPRIRGCSRGGEAGNRLIFRSSAGLEAREFLAPFCRCFTEGFNTPDLKQAKALLEELG
jgi:hypothetical protein